MTPDKVKRQPQKRVVKKPIDRNDPQYLMYKAMPFKRRKMSFADWIYKNKIGVSALVLIFVAIFFMFVSVKIDLTQMIVNQGFYLETPPLEEEIVAEVPVEEIIPEMMEEQIYEDIQNISVNKGAELDAGLKDDRGTEASDIYEEAKALQDRLDANKAANQKALAEATLYDNSKPKRESVKGESDKKSDQSNVKGKVTVSYDLDGRRASYLPIPAYKCQGGGEVVVDIVVNDNGNVISAEVARSSSSRSSCISDTALAFAKDTRFELNSKWKQKHKGTITYIFLNQ